MDRIHAGSLAFMSKPVAHSIGRNMNSNMMQTLLFWGSYWGANWVIGDDKAPFGQVALDYAPLFRQLRGKLWSGQAHAVSVVGGGAQANLFEIEPRKGEELTATGDVSARVRVLVVVFGPASGNVTVALGGPTKYANATLFHPGPHFSSGVGEAIIPPTKAANGVTEISVPLSHGDPHGVAVVRLTPASGQLQL